MGATLIDSAIFGDIFSTPAMRRVWSDENRTAKYLEIEKALAKVQGRLGIIPQEAADEIVRNCDVSRIDMDKLRAQTERIGYPVLGVVSQLNALCRDKLGEYCHWGATTQDITDTATVLQMRDGLELIEADLDAIAGALAALARRYRDTPIIGRSNLQQAIPVTFGFKMAAILAGIERHRRAPGRVEAAGTDRRVRRRVRDARVDREGRTGNAGRPDGGAWACGARHRLAHGARHHRGSRLLPRVGGRLARQDRNGRQADDAARGGRGLRTVRAGTRVEQHDAAEAQSDFELLYPRGGVDGAPAHGGAARRDDRRPRTVDRSVGNRMDRAAGGLLPDRRRVEADTTRPRAGSKSTRPRCAPTSTSLTAS